MNIKVGDLVSWKYQETDLGDRLVGDPTYAEGTVVTIDKDGWIEVRYSEESIEYLHLGNPAKSFFREEHLTVW